MNGGPEWRALYRLQLRPDFGFDDAAKVVPYLATLGVSHLYLSPVVEAAAGSEHGYDVVDPSRLRDELGGRTGFDHLAACAADHGLGIVLDIVPNHMAVGGAEGLNRWWWDLLKHGRASRHAASFDVAWDDTGDDRVLLPVLDDHFRNVVEAGRIAVRRTDHDFEATFEDRSFPLDITTLADLLRGAAATAADAVLAVLADALASLDEREQPPERRRAEAERLEAAVVAHLRGAAGGAVAVDALLADHNADPRRLGRLLGRQRWRLARWQIANREIGYRRFFDVTDLAALRTDLGPVFDAVHQLPVGLVRGGQVAGLRIDHPDGLRDPEAYLEQLTQRLPGTPVWVEKILAPHEELPDTWPVEGTTGYEFMNLVLGLFVDPDGARALQRMFVAETGAVASFDEAAWSSKHAVLSGLLAADVDRVTTVAVRACAQAGWDASRDTVRRIVAELAAALPVYRTYVRAGHDASEHDRAVLAGTVADARRRRPDLEDDLIEAVARFLTRPASPDEIELAMRFQQLSTTAAAKGVEDTACYRWAPLAALCEVGGRPDATGTSIEEFHTAMLHAAARWPHRLLETSTHDTKRSEDVRARLALLSEDPGGWAADLIRLRAAIDVPAPDRTIELLGFQTVVGAWPIEQHRLTAYLVKAAREAKQATSWLAPDDAYERALVEWGAALATSPVAGEIASRLIEPGCVTSLAQLVLKLTAPGVPGIYQGTEQWDLSLVDPDNRRPVDFGHLAHLVHASPTDGERCTKLDVMRAVLGLRRDRPDHLDGTAPYLPLLAEGPAAEHVVSYVRGESVTAVAPRLVRTLARNGGWRDTTLTLTSGTWTDVLTGATWRGRVALDDLLHVQPVAVLTRQ